MAWTPPRTWSPGETVTASLMNAQIRDNMNVVSTAFVKGGAWVVSTGITAADYAAVWYCDHPATVTSVKGYRKGGTGATINARKTRPAAAIAKAFQVDGSAGPSYVDQTTAINNATAADVTPFPASEDTSDYFLVGFASKWRALRYLLSTAGTAVAGATWEYWNGSAWTAIINGVDTANLGGFMGTAGTIWELSWSPQANWTATVINGSASLYWVRLKITSGSYTVNPILTQAWALEGGDLLASDLSLTTEREWMDGGAITSAFSSFAVGDTLEIVARTVTGSPTEVAIQCGMSLA